MALVATWFVMEHEIFSCEKCLAAPRDQVERRQRKLNCKGLAPGQKGGLVTNGIRFRACIGSFWSWEAAHLIRMWWAMQRGIQVFQGPWPDQPAKLMQAFDVLDGLQAEKHAEEKAKEKQKWAKTK